MTSRPNPASMTRQLLAAAVIVATLVMAIAAPARARHAIPASRSAGATAQATAKVATATLQVPVLAYYYIWYDTDSWNRAKSDLPLLGKYSSDNTHVMREHIRWAKSAGIEGFIVSWKHTATLDRRLAKLIDVAESENFKLAIIYQGLDFSRNPLPADRVATDLDYFVTTFASRTAFQIPAFSKPLVIWSGTWMFDRADIARVTTQRRDQLLLLASERNLDGYQRLADVVDGDAYYWSSVNPATTPGYLAKLTEMGRAVRRNGGTWIPPAAPGFDARKVGGSSVVERRNGKTLRQEIDTALAASPSALGLISWNEFSESSHLEPSAQYANRYLDVLSARLGDGPQPPPPGQPSATDTTDSSSSGTNGFPMGIPAMGGFLLLLAGSVLVVARRGSGGRGRGSGGGSGGGGPSPRGPGSRSPRSGRAPSGSGSVHGEKLPGQSDNGAPRAPDLVPGARVQRGVVAWLPRPEGAVIAGKSARTPFAATRADLAPLRRRVGD